MILIKIRVIIALFQHCVNFWRMRKIKDVFQHTKLKIFSVPSMMQLVKNNNFLWRIQCSATSFAHAYNLTYITVL